MPSFLYNLQYLSSAYRIVRKRAAQQECSSDKAKLAKHEDMELLLDNEQSEKLCTLMKTIEATCSSEDFQDISLEFWCETHGNWTNFGKLFKEPDKISDEYICHSKLIYTAPL